MIAISYDETTNIARTVAAGITPPDELERYLTDLHRHASRARSEKGRFLHLVDAVDIAVQPRENFERLARHAVEHGRESDRNAVVMRSTLARMQIALLSTRACIRIFSDLAEAEAWLVAESRA